MTERPSAAGSRRVLGVPLEDLRRAGEGVWLLLSLLSLATLGWGLAASEETLLRWSAWLRGGHDALHPCLLCGMTRLGRGQRGSWAQASSPRNLFPCSDSKPTSSCC